MEISSGKKHFTLGKKFRKNDFAPSEKFSCYAPDFRVQLHVYSFSLSADEEDDLITFCHFLKQEVYYIIMGSTQ